jgi:aspartate 1-decarboxylase
MVKSKILISRADYPKEKLEHHVARIVCVDSQNRVIGAAAARAEAGSLTVAET